MTADDMRRLWMDGVSVAEIAKRAKCHKSTIYMLRDRYQWPGVERETNEPPPPSPEDARLSEDSLALSPWVQARADEIRAQRQEKLEAEPWSVTRTRLWKAGHRALS